MAECLQVDNDVYAASNLTRQCLGGKADVGERILGMPSHKVAVDSYTCVQVGTDNSACG